MSGHVALVTGASTGIGRAIAIALGRRGVGVGVNYHSGGERAQEVVRDITTAGGRAVAVGGDVSRHADVERMVADTEAKLGPIDILVNNAGIEKGAAFIDVAERDWDLILGVDLKGAFLCAQAVVRRMLAAKRSGHIVNISSVHEELAMPGNTPYVCAKGGMRMLARNLALELAPHGITVVNVGPGAIATPMNQGTLSDPEKKLALVNEIPAGRIGTPEEVGALVAYLVSDEASYITGTTVFIDGGLMRQTGRL